MKTEQQLAVQTTTVVSPFLDTTKFEILQRACGAFIHSELVPKMYQVSPTNPREKAIANCMIAINMASRINADELMVMQNLYIVHGQPAWSSKFLIATVNASGRFSPIRYEWKSEQGKDEWACRAFTYDATDKERKEPLYGTWVSIAMAKKEGWYSKNGSKWQTIPELMLQYRAATFWCRTYAPELSMGLHTVEERQDIVDVEYEDVTDKVNEEIAHKANAGKPLSFDAGATGGDNTAQVVVDKETGEITEQPAGEGNANPTPPPAGPQDSQAGNAKGTQQKMPGF
ncbi:MAG: hypothetical protein EZS26_000775 [Candidatus Ordinivivax streblomastigis]|uniref:Recombinase RecT n=1 Tax=Candidatus Ordinivivax streblomastigis TaxID=2540710 RepID=A0A5M8P4B5_9BACT|nr:MAG: hypothetical protein EZS26_000775 [Candidatus Ordinivivax streblomastigis]